MLSTGAEVPFGASSGSHFSTTVEIISKEAGGIQRLAVGANAEKSQTHTGGRMRGCQGKKGGREGGKEGGGACPPTGVKEQYALRRQKV